MVLCQLSPLPKKSPCRPVGISCSEGALPNVTTDFEVMDSVLTSLPAPFLFEQFLLPLLLVLRGPHTSGCVVLIFDHGLLAKISRPSKPLTWLEELIYISIVLPLPALLLRGIFPKKETVNAQKID